MPLPAAGNSDLITAIQPIIWVDDTAQLAQLCAAWHEKELLAVDTEFIRTRTYYPIPALIQVFDGSSNYLIDPVAIDDFAPLTALMNNPAVIKAMHSCSEDLEVFARLLGVLPQTVCDTQIAASLCGCGHSVGYANLVSSLLGVTLPKEETRSDWLQRPLTQAQCTYAALDVQYLYSLALELLQKLDQAGRRDWLLQEYARLQQGFNSAEQSDNALARFKLAWRLNPRQLRVLQRLALWREQTARELDLPRNRLVPERSLQQIAEMQPGHISQLRGVEELPERTLRLHGEQMIDIVRAALAEDESDLPQALPKPLDRPQRQRLQLLRERFAARAEELGIAAEIFARKTDFDHMVRALEAGERGRDILPPTYTGWRLECVTDAMLEDL